MVLTDDEAIAKKINSAVFPGLQGGPLMHVIAAKAVAFGEALQPDFKSYIAGGGRERQGAGGDAQGARRRPRLGRHRHASRAGRPDARSASPARTPTRRWSAPASPATRTASRSIRCRRSRPAASASARPPARRAASAPPSSARSATWSPTCSTACARMASRATRRSRRNVRERVRALCARFPIYPKDKQRWRIRRRPGNDIKDDTRPGQEHGRSGARSARSSRSRCRSSARSSALLAGAGYAYYKAQEDGC